MISAARALLATVAALAVALAVLVLPGAGSTTAAPAVAGVFPLDGEPGRLVAGPDGNMWVGITGNSGGNDIARVSPAGVITYYDLPVGNLGFLTVGPDQNLWATLSTGVVKIPTGSPTTATEYNIAGFSDAQGIDTGPDGNLWAASGDRVFRIPLADPTTAAFFAVPGMAARQLVASADRIWVADFAGGRVHALTTAGVRTPHLVGGSPQGIAAGPGGQVLYSNPENGANHAARLTLGGAPAKTPLPGTDPSFGVTLGADGNYWVGLFLTGEMARITPAGQLTRFGTFPAPYKPRYVEVGPAGTVWASLQDPGNDGAVGRVTGVTADKTVAIRLKGTRVKVRGTRALVRLRCPQAEASGPCAGKVTLRGLRGKKARLGKKKYVIAAGRTKVVKVRLRRGVAASIPRTGLRVRAVVTVRDTAGNRKTARKVVRFVKAGS